MRLTCFGPFDVPSTEQRKNRYWRKTFFDAVEDSSVGLSKARGCYAFFIKHGNSLTPWYVGQAKGNDGFRQEIFQNNHKKKIVDDLSVKRGATKLLLFPIVRNKSGKFSSKTDTKASALTKVEALLIAWALDRNSNLLNLQQTSLLRDTKIDGLLNYSFPKGPRSGSPAAIAEKVFYGQ